MCDAERLSVLAAMEMPRLRIPRARLCSFQGSSVKEGNPAPETREEVSFVERNLHKKASYLHYERISWPNCFTLSADAIVEDLMLINLKVMLEKFKCDHQVSGNEKSHFSWNTFLTNIESS